MSEDDGNPMLLGLTGSYLEKYNTTATSVPVLSIPAPPPVDLWSLDEPQPIAPSAVTFVSSAAELATDLNRPWVGARVVVVLSNITLDAATWPKVRSVGGWGG